MKLTTYLCLLLRLRMCGAIHLLSNTSSWCGAKLSTGTIYFCLVFFCYACMSHLYCLAEQNQGKILSIVLNVHTVFHCSLLQLIPRHSNDAHGRLEQFFWWILLVGSFEFVCLYTQRLKIWMLEFPGNCISLVQEGIMQQKIFYCQLLWSHKILCDGCDKELYHLYKAIIRI